MAKQVLGIHHVTAIASDPQRNLDFYTGVLGLHLVKLTVNFDDPGTYHFYFGDEVGHPGTLLTFFPWPDVRRGRRGNGQVAVVSFSIPENAMGYWRERLRQHLATESALEQRFEEEALSFLDPDGLQIELVAHAEARAFTPWEGGPVPAVQAIRGFHSVTLWEEGYERTARLLTETMGFRLLDSVSSAGNRFRYAVDGEGGARIVDLICLPSGPAQQMGAGVVHHVAFRTPDDEQQRVWRAELAGLGYNVTPIIDRQYFHSIYYREPGGVLFEIATDPPGFMLDEPVDQLGTHLKLPPQYEAERAAIERVLPPLRRDQPAASASGTRVGHEWNTSGTEVSDDERQSGHAR